MSGLKPESVQCTKDLGVTIASNMKFSLHCKEAACKANRMLGFINGNLSSKNKDYNSTIVVYQLSQTPFGVCDEIIFRSCPA